MKKIPLWGKITGGCCSLLLLFVLIAGCAGIVGMSGSDPVADPEPVATQEEEPATATEEPEVTEEKPEPEKAEEPKEEKPAPEPEKTEDPAPEAEKETEAVEEEALDTSLNAESGLPINTCVSDIDSIMYDLLIEYVYPEVTIDRDSVYLVHESVDNNNMYLVAGSDKGIIIFYVSETDGMAYAATPAAYDYSDLVFAEDLGATIPDSDAFHVAFSCSV